MDQNTNQYVSHVFTDGEILTADDMNNIIAGIDENAEKIDDLDSLTQDISQLDVQLDAIADDVSDLQNKVPNTPSDSGTSWLSASQPGNTYLWVKQSAVQVYSDPGNDGNIIISDEVVELL